MRVFIYLGGLPCDVNLNAFLSFGYLVTEPQRDQRLGGRHNFPCDCYTGSLPSSCPAPTLRETLPATPAMQCRGTVKKESCPGVPCPGSPGLPPLRAHLSPSLSQLTCKMDSPSSKSSSGSGESNSARKHGCNTAQHIHICARYTWHRRKRL